tara:strand:+ start:125 stop:328 length:204 start_codon:yes stop_codon:yes gene_type:complete
MNLGLLSNILKITGNVIIESSKIVEELNDNIEKKEESLKNNKKNINCYFKKYENKCTNKNCPYNHDF